MQRTSVRLLTALIALAAVAAAMRVVFPDRVGDLVAGEPRVLHAPAVVSRKVMPLTANVIVRWSGEGALRQRVNGGAWRAFEPQPPRVQRGVVPVEIDPAELFTDRENVVEIEDGATVHEARFRYDPDPPRLPLRIDWRGAADRLEVQDGAWEVIEVDGEARARPVPGTEGYDRILLLCGAFRGGRRVSCDVVLREPVEKGQLWGFGPLPYWAGHPDPEDQRPRRGWEFSLSWYYSKYGALGLEFSTKVGGAEMDWVATYRSAKLERHVVWRSVTEAFAERRADGTAVRHRMRTRWWPRGEDEPADWLELVDRPGAPLPDDEFAVAFVVHRCQVEIGDVLIEAVPDVVVDD